MQEQLDFLEKLTKTESAQIIFGRPRGTTPGFGAQIVRVAPRPDDQTDAVDYTLTVALHEAVESLKRQIQARRTERRVKDKAICHVGSFHVADSAPWLAIGHDNGKFQSLL